MTGYCTRRHEHGASCLPPADPRDPELRLLRAIYGLCPICDVPEPHRHSNDVYRQATGGQS